MIFLNSCQKKKISDNFTLLPTVKNLQYNGKSSVLDYNSEFNYYSKSNELPVLLINQTLNMDWQFISEIKLFEKINLTYN